MATISKLKPGQIVYSVERRRMGNTTLTTISVYDVRIIEVHERHVTASWNGNRPQDFYRHEIGHWKVKKPITVETGMWGQVRLARRDEIAAMTSMYLAKGGVIPAFSGACLAHCVQP